MCVYQVKFKEEITKDTFNNKKNVKGYNSSMLFAFDDIPLDETYHYYVNSSIT
ncbi:MAG: hypothetical protein ACMG6E_09060 [Candidatus Roizmanbacteria bacterium]